ncbi:MAG: hypothetical protein AVDCRST_MAG49-1238 [uncultured Thermomicrobiales bacterium]|uniref:SMP-30/Gluconolactonase/LRE-like region domain-containing protein n=1 Tax=uncultured Thermomicrobiales bacterium TaxID=1645740 RepID=A0A6J4U8L8_9BACT|nr:MAG: hypothetical protein AVDCRST_MAG49-1238 [uncultured Thermomicrobiales bacterium]
MRRFLRAVPAITVGLSMVATSVVATSAQGDATPGASPGALPAGCDVVAEGLINPRYVAVADDGTLYITEAGNGGDETVAPPEPEEAPQVAATPKDGEATPEDGEATPEGEEGAAEGDEAPPVTRGFTGQLTAVSPDGEQTVVADGLPSYNEGVGPTGIALGEGVVWISVGGAAATLGADPLENENSILAVDLATGEAAQVAELGSFELENNPDGTDVNPNLYGMDLGADGLLYVNDAGGNTLYSVDPATGEFALVGVVPGPALPGEAAQPADATPVADEEPGGEIQPVPTGLDVGADGNVYVVTLGALAPEASTVLIAQADGTFVDVATGLTVGIGVALGPDGELYVSQLATFVGEAPGPGNVVRIGEDGSFETVVDGIPFAHGITFDDEGNLYVIASSTAFGPPPAEPNGQVLRCDGIAA